MTDATNSGLDESNKSSSSDKRKICLNCHAEVTNNLTCSRCKVGRYCNRDCQIQHYSIHKLHCIDSSSDDKIEKLVKKGENFFDQGNLIDAERIYKKAFKKLNQSEDNSDLHIYNTLSVMNNLGSIYSKTGRLIECENI